VRALGKRLSDLTLTSPERQNEISGHLGMTLLGFAGLGFAFRQSRRKVSFA
jgi:hypothetical protein